LINPLAISVIRKLKHLLEFIGVIVLLQTVRALPRPVLLAFGRALGRLTFGLLRIRRQVTLENMRQAFPEKSASEILALGKRCYEHFGMMMLEYLRMQSMTRDELLALVDDENGAATADLDRALREKTGAILVSAHFGNWEYLAAWLAVKGYPMSIINQPQNNPYADRFIQQTRASMGMQMIERGSMGLRLILRALRERRMVFIAPDQDAGRDGIFVPFFGRPASVARGAAAFVLKTGVPIVICMLRRRTDYGYTLTTERVEIDLSPAWEDDQKMMEITARYTKAIENHIRRCPEQWFWLHRRWKTKPPQAEATSQPALKENL
jgi:KDO2-lipid IV(A) lauroyltransferase